jgi:hypothetical protein
VTDSDAAIAFLRTSGAEWFDVPGSQGRRRFTYATELQPRARRRGLNWEQLEPALSQTVERCGGTHRRIQHWSLWRGLWDGVRGRDGWHWTTYYELPREFFR